MLGAGASIDAGLLDSCSLTEAVYKKLQSGNVLEAELFAFVIAKLIVRQTRQGESPFNKIDIESAYDALKRILSHDDDILSEFVSGWDILADRSVYSRPQFSQFDFERTFSKTFKISSTRSLTAAPSLTVDTRSVHHIAQLLSTQFRTAPDRTPNLSVFTEALASCLNIESENEDYLSKLAQHCRSHADCLGTLNYDLLIERRCQNLNIPYGYGLKNWNLRRYIKFPDDEMKIIKLHGSLNWHFENDDSINISEGDFANNKRRALVFGGQADKLDADGPFLSLRHEFFRRMRQSTTLVVAGYSFRDKHVNALLKSWLLTKKKGKIIVVSPDTSSHLFEMLKYTYRIIQGQLKRAVEVKLINGRLSECIDELIVESKIPPVLTHSDFSESDFRDRFAVVRRPRGLAQTQPSRP